ncbi:acetyltransferase [Bacillus sp. FJAT-27986]|uniref:acetyltransferase n=1 Tax=Bacillus sp. FJAT-27986 TaxID=1743146 RepID=UPI00080AF3C7|nr:acetyltransferase [Bacillus sp. FJAT-27986]OCA89966.1 acetyltransferase [Bacillus sp. FJAT-27986]
MSWYKRLREYFPEEEMKSEEHINMLLNHGQKDYFLDNGKNHILLYAEKENFIFVDYLYVMGNARGNGTGKKVLDKLKLKGKPIFLEVEPINESEEDSEKRLRFYKREGFKHANTVSYIKNSLATNKDVELEILYWSPEADKHMDQEVLDGMKEIYRDLHTYKDEELYGGKYRPTEKALKIKENKSDILDEITS